MRCIQCIIYIRFEIQTLHHQKYFITIIYDSLRSIIFKICINAQNMYFKLEKVHNSTKFNPLIFFFNY